MTNKGSIFLMENKAALTRKNRHFKKRSERITLQLKHKKAKSKRINISWKFDFVADMYGQVFRLKYDQTTRGNETSG